MLPTRCKSRILAIALLLAVSVLLPAHAESELENKVKAAFVYNFAKFIDWPMAGNIDSRDFSICVAGQSSLGDTIERSLKGKSIRNRSIHVRHIGWSSAQLDGCHMLYLNGSDSPATAQLLAAARSKPILTIGETEGFSRDGGIIQFLLVEGKVRFIINQAAAETVGLNISAKLLEVAFHVRRNSAGISEIRHGWTHALLS